MFNVTSAEDAPLHRPPGQDDPIRARGADLCRIHSGIRTNPGDSTGILDAPGQGDPRSLVWI